MSSQPTTPQPSTTTTATAPATTKLEPNDTNRNNDLNDTKNQYPSSPPLPLETQKYNNSTANNMVTPGTPSSSNYHSHVNNSTLRDRKDTLINETCPSFGPTDYAHNIVSLDRHTT